MIQVANIKTHKGVGYYIGRDMPGRKGSALANRWHVGADGTRAQVIEKYARWFAAAASGYDRAACKELESLKAQHERGEAIVLLCWCHPKACHGDVIKAWLDNLAASQHSLFENVRDHAWPVWENSWRCWPRFCSPLITSESGAN